MYSSSFSSNNYNLQREAQRLMSSQDMFAWKELRSLLPKNDCPVRLPLIEGQNFPIIMYAFKLTHKRASFSDLWISVSHYADQLNFFNASIISTAHKIMEDQDWQETLQMVVEAYLLYLRRHDAYSQVQMTSLVYLTQFTRADEGDKFKKICELVACIKESKFNASKQNFILRTILESLGSSIVSSQNSFLLFDPMLIREEHIEYECAILADIIIDLDENYLCNVLLNLVGSCLTREVVKFIEIISYILCKEEDFFKLKIIYQRVILPQFALRYKACHRLQGQILELCSYYILGFYKYFRPCGEFMAILLQSLEHLANPRVQDEWISICFVQLEKQGGSQLRKQVIEHLTRFGLKFQQAQANASLLKQKGTVWDINARESRKLKKYPKISSERYKGIQNTKNHCYIIAPIQALYLSPSFKKFMEKNRQLFRQKTLPIFYEIKLLFGQLDQKAKAKVSVIYLKQLGPSEFSESQQQEDAQQYLIRLFECLQNQLGGYKELTQEFKDIFQNEVENTIQCSKCRHTVQNLEQEYIISIHPKSNFQLNSEQPLEDYKCQQCQQSNCIKKQRYQLKSQLLIIHINRFEHRGGRTNKILATTSIARSIQDYKLSGFICHKGKDVSGGHYVYYAQLEPQRWVEMNDEKIWEFTLSQPGEQFERQMKSEITPYILFYSRRM